MGLGRRTRLSRVFAWVTVLALLAGMMPLAVVAEGPLDLTDPAELHRQLVEVDSSRRAVGRSEAELVPEEVFQLFEGGLTAAELVDAAGYVPRALEGLVDQDQLVIIQMEGDPIAALPEVQQAAQGGASISSAALGHANALEAAQAELQGQIEALGAQVISKYTVVYNGIQARVPAKQLATIRELPGVAAVHRAPVHKPALGASVPIMGVDWVVNEFGFDGEGITIAIIDTGIDYTHATLGGGGTPLQYEMNDPNWVEPNTFPTLKVVGGYDFAGTLYDAGCTAAEEAAGVCSATPLPDEDPLDEYGHGTHVASIAAGVAAGSVMTGTAPGASLMALKVFGQAGSTSLTIDALEYATLHYLQWGWPQVINMSLGSPFGANDASDPSVYGTNLAASVGIVVVASAGNEGNVEYITGSPAVADKAISVAASTTGYATGPTVSIQDTPFVTQTNIIYQPASFDGNTGRIEEAITAPVADVRSLTDVGDPTLCDVTGVPAGSLDGEIALIQRGTCSFSEKVENAADLGAVAAVIYNNEAGIISMIGTPVSIPACSIQQLDGLNLRNASGQTAVISAESDVTTIEDPYTPADTMADFSSRGPRGYDSMLKPDVTAPGVAIFAADIGTGMGGVSMNGTSMAAPHVAGVAALVKEAHRDWSPQRIKAAIMNTADPDVSDGGDWASPLRMGVGRVDAVAAIALGASAVADEDLVSLNWGVVRSNENTATLQGTVRFEVSPEVVLPPGMTLEGAILFASGSLLDGVIDASLDPVTFTVPATGSVDVTVTIELDLAAVPLVGGFNWLEEYAGFVVLGPSSGDAGPTAVMDDLLKVPFYFQVKPYNSLEIYASDVITHPMRDLAIITATHTGPQSSYLYAYSALQASDAPDPALQGAADVRMLGMGGWTDSSYGPMLEVAINTWEPWHVPQPYFAEFDLYVDSDRDGIEDWVLFNYNYGAIADGADDNTWIVVQVDLASGMSYLGSPYLIYTDFNNAYAEWWVPVSWLDLGPGRSAFDYQLVSFDTYGTPGVNPPGSFDPLKLPFIWAIFQDPGPGGEGLALAAVESLSGYRLAEPLGLMLVDYAGDPTNQDGSQTYLIPLDVLYKHQTNQPLILANWAGEVPR